MPWTETGNAMDQAYVRWSKSSSGSSSGSNSVELGVGQTIAGLLPENGISVTTDVYIWLIFWVFLNDMSMI